MAILNVGTLGPYFDLQSALDAAQPGDTIIINTLNPGGGDYAHGSVWDEGITITTAVDVGTVQFGLTGGIFDVTATGPSDFIIFGNANNNILTAGDGDDLLFGAAGNDTLNGGAGADIASYIYDPAGVSINLATGTGTDGFGGTDTLNSIEAIAGSQFGDTLIGDANDNYFLGLGGNDTINGGDGIDTLSYEDVGLGGGAVTVNLATGVATDGLGGTDTISGIEYVIGTRYGDTLTGDGGENWFLPDGGNDAIDGGSGMDYVSYESALTGVNVNLSTQTASDGLSGSDTLLNIEGVVGSSFADTIIGDANANILTGLAGSDWIIGGDGIDTASYAGSSAGVDANLETRRASDGSGSTDTLSSIESLIGSAFSDTLTGNDEDNVFTGLQGDDLIVGGGGTDEVSYEFDLSAYTVRYNSANNSYTVIANIGSEGTDTLFSVELVRFGGGASPVDINSVAENPLEVDGTFVGDDDDNTFNPGDGDDTVDGRGGVDTVTYAASTAGVSVNLTTGTAIDGMGGSDTLTSIERVIGSAFDDTLTGSNSNEIFLPGLGNNTIDGGGGEDTLSYEGREQGISMSADGSRISHYTGSPIHYDYFSDIEVFVGTQYGDRYYNLPGDQTFDGGFQRGGAVDSVSFQLSHEGRLVDMRSGLVRSEGGELDKLIGIGRVTTGNGDDTFIAGSGNADYDASGGNNTLSFAQHESAVNINELAQWVRDEDEHIIYIRGFSTIVGSQFDDTFLGYSSRETVFSGGAGDDEIVARDDVARGDWASYQFDPSGVVVNLAAGVAADGYGGTDSLSGVSRVVGSEFADMLTGDDANNLLKGLGGSDVLYGGLGVDRAIYILSKDQYTVSYDSGSNSYTVVALSGEEGTDTLVSIEVLSFNDGTVDVAIADAVEHPDTTSDFDGDGDDDIVFSLTPSGNSVFNNADGTGGGWIGYSDRTVIGTGDFNGDGDADLLFRFADGNHSGFDSGGGGPWFGRSDRTAVAVGDFNGDGDDDVLFQFANGNKHIADADSGNTWVGFADRSIEGVGDFDGDGDDDVLFELNAGGYVTNNVDGTGGRWLGGPNRDVAGIGDFDGDGDDDILFVLNSGGHIINDGEGGGMQWFGFTDRSVAGIGDFDGDGNDDILFRLSDGNHTIISPNGVGRWIARTNNTVRDVGDYDGDGDDDILFEAPGGGFVVDQADGGAGLGMYFLDRTLVAGDPMGIGLTSDADLV